MSLAKNRHHWNFFGFLVGLFVLGIVAISYHPEQPSTWSTLVHGMGEAFVIAALLAGSVDLYVKRLLTREISVDVAAAVAGSEMPDEIRRAIKEGFNPDLLVRYDHYQRYTIEVDKDPKFVIVTTTCRYKARNFGRDPYKYQPFLSLEEVAHPEFCELSVNGVTIDAGSLKARRVRQNPEVPEGLGTVFVKGDEITIPGKRADEEPSAVQVHWRTRQRMEAESSDVIFLGNHINLEIEADVPEDFTFWVEPQADDSECLKKNGSLWKYKRLFRNDVVRVRWWRSARSKPTGGGGGGWPAKFHPRQK